MITEEIQDIRELLEDCPDDLTKYQTIIEMGDDLDPYPESYKLDELKVSGCQSDLWLYAEFWPLARYMRESVTAYLSGLLYLEVP